jgi:plastocyanin
MTHAAPIRRLSLAAIAAMVLMLLQLSPAAAADGTVYIRVVEDATSTPKPVRFEPAAIVVQVGDSVTWVNEDTEGRTFTLVADMNAWETPPIGPGEEQTVKFDAPGAYIYHTHENAVLTGLVVVEEGTGESPAPTDATEEPTAQPTDEPTTEPTASTTSSPTAPPSGTGPPTDTINVLTASGGGTPPPIALILLFGVLLPVSWRLVDRRRAARAAGR